MCENYVFVLPVNILTGVVRRLLEPHDTLPCVLITGVARRLIEPHDTLPCVLIHARKCRIGGMLVKVQLYVTVN